MSSIVSKPSNISQYIASFPQPTREKLNELFKIIEDVVPDATQNLKWGMPAFSYKRILVTFAGFKNHIGFYPAPSAIKAFEKELSKYKSAKGSVQFPLDTPLPTGLIKKMIRFRVKESVEAKLMWRS